jgi:hypothetical protein
MTDARLAKTFGVFLLGFTGIAAVRIPYVLFFSGVELTPVQQFGVGLLLTARAAVLGVFAWAVFAGRARARNWLWPIVGGWLLGLSRLDGWIFLVMGIAAAVASKRAQAAAVAEPLMAAEGEGAH